jgi:hypothetical protein
VPPSRAAPSWWCTVADPQALHAELLAEVRRQDPYELLWGWIAVKAVLELHKPESFGGVIACLACSPGMPPPILIEWKDCPTVKGIAAALGVTTDG